MDPEHYCYERASTQQRGNTLESNAERFAKEGARKGLPTVANPARTINRMFETFVGKRLTEPARPSKPTTWYDEEEEKSSYKDKKDKRDKQEKAHRESSGVGETKQEALARLARADQKRKAESAAAAAEDAQLAGMDPKFANIIKRFRKEHAR